jgi:hypothetical protein
MSDHVLPQTEHPKLIVVAQRMPMMGKHVQPAVFCSSTFDHKMLVVLFWKGPGKACE